VTAGVELIPDTLINHRYRVRRVLGRGGCGKTYLAADECRFGELCVLKEFVPTSQGDAIVAQKLRELFRREASILHKLNHPQIPKFYAGFELNDRLFIVQEFIDGKTCWRLLQERRQQGSTFTEAEIIQWLWDLLHVLDYLHAQKIVHRDISPDNVMISQKRNLPILIDFGVVKQATQVLNSPHSNGLIQASVAVGKFGYAPFEQIRMGQCSPRSDIYALGVTAIVLLTGQTPNLLMDPRTLEWKWQKDVNLDRRFVTLLNKMTAERPKDRYPSARAVLQDLYPLKAAIGERLPLISTSPLSSPVRFTQLQPTGSSTALADPQTEAELTGFSTQHQRTTTSKLFPSDAFPITSSSLSKYYDNQPGTTGLVVKVTVSNAPVPARKLPQFFEKPVNRLLMWVFLLILPIIGALVGVQSPHIASLCQSFNNCVGTQSEERYLQVLEQAVSAKTLFEQAQNLPDLQKAHDRLSASLLQLHAFTTNPQVYHQAQQSLHEYQSVLQGVTSHLEQETRAAQLLQRAEREAQQATKQTQTAKTAKDFEIAKQKWSKALSTLQAIPAQTFVIKQAKARSQEYNARLDSVAVEIATLQPKQMPDEWLQPVIQPISVSALPKKLSFPNSLQPNHSPVVPVADQNEPSVQAASAATPQPPSPASSRVSRPRVSGSEAKRPKPAQPTLVSRRSSGSPISMSAQRANEVFMWVDRVWLNQEGIPVANLMIANYSDRSFSFNPLYAEVVTASGQLQRSRILFTSSVGLRLQPGETLSGQVSLLDRSGDSLLPEASLVIQEGVNGNRTFHVPFQMSAY
jgi:serine/threonine protein kinase